MKTLIDLGISLMFAFTVYEAVRYLGMLWVIGAEAYDDTE